MIEWFAIDERMDEIFFGNAHYQVASGFAVSFFIWAFVFSWP
jgi:hypothetical protein